MFNLNARAIRDAEVTGDCGRARRAREEVFIDVLLQDQSHHLGSYLTCTGELR